MHPRSRSSPHSSWHSAGGCCTCDERHGGRLAHGRAGTAQQQAAGRTRHYCREQLESATASSQHIEFKNGRNTSVELQIGYANTQHRWHPAGTGQRSQPGQRSQSQAGSRLTRSRHAGTVAHVHQHPEGYLSSTCWAKHNILSKHQNPDAPSFTDMMWQLAPCCGLSSLAPVEQRQPVYSL